MPEKSVVHPGTDSGSQGELDQKGGSEGAMVATVSTAQKACQGTPPDAARTLDCVGKDAGESACEMANAEEEERERGSNST